MISRSTIDQVYEAARVEEVIGDFISLKKSGSNFKGLSPFSQERTPSFMVSPVKQIWKDFSSGKGGNVVAFLMEHEHFTYPESIEFLAKKYNIEIEKTEQSTAEKKKTNQREKGGRNKNSWIYSKKFTIIISMIFQIHNLKNYGIYNRIKRNIMNWEIMFFCFALSVI